jgi:hypothetical protein
MSRCIVLILAALALVGSQAPFVTFVRAQSQAPSKEPPTIKIPDGGVPQALTMEGRYVRAAYNNEAYTILGYRLANLSVGEEWLLLEVGLALREKTRDYTLTRAEVSLDTPDGKTIPLPDIKEFRAGNTSALKARERVQRDSINYFPPNAYQACAIQFFPDLEQRAMPYDQVELTNHRACLGRFYFKVPGGITYGQHWLNVKFAESTLRVPFRILTEDEEKVLEKHYKSIKKQVDEAFRPKKKSS